MDIKGEIDSNTVIVWFFSFLKNVIYSFLKRRERREKEEEKHKCVVASQAPPTGDLARNPGMCPEWASNWQQIFHRLALNPLSHTSQGIVWDFNTPLISMDRAFRQK